MGYEVGAAGRCCCGCCHRRHTLRLACLPCSITLPKACPPPSTAMARKMRWRSGSAPCQAVRVSMCCNTQSSTRRVMHYQVTSMTSGMHDTLYVLRSTCARCSSFTQTCCCCCCCCPYCGSTAGCSPLCQFSAAMHLSDCPSSCKHPRC